MRSFGLPEVRVGFDPLIGWVAHARVKGEEAGLTCLDYRGGKFVELLYAGFPQGFCKNSAILQLLVDIFGGFHGVEDDVGIVLQSVEDGVAEQDQFHDFTPLCVMSVTNLIEGDFEIAHVREVHCGMEAEIRAEYERRGIGLAEKVAI